MLHNLIQIVIADDNLFFVDALKDSLKQHNIFNVINTFTSIEGLTAFTDKTDFDILILDINFNGDNALDFIEDIKKEHSTFKVIVLTTFNNNYIKRFAFSKGIDCFVGKDSDLNDFKDIIIDCCNNKQSSTYLVDNAKIHIANTALTSRKIEVLQALYKYSDKTEAEIAKQLFITLSALKTHKQELFEITNTKNTPQLLKFGVENGLILI